jgi:phosphatidylinositol phospholipase C delta/inactive phospholipase C-like protein 2
MDVISKEEGQEPSDLKLARTVSFRDSFGLISQGIMDDQMPGTTPAYSAEAPMVSHLPVSVAQQLSRTTLGIHPKSHLPICSYRSTNRVLTELDHLAMGVSLLKIDPKKRSNKPKERVFRLDLLRRQLRWQSKRKPPELTTINIDDILEVRAALSAPLTGPTIPTTSNPSSAASSQANGNGNGKETDNASESRGLSIHYTLHGDPKVLDLLCPTFQFRDTLVGVLEDLRHHAKTLDGRDHTIFLVHTWIHRAWAATDRNGNNRVDFDDVSRALKSFNVSLSKEELRRVFAQYNPSATGYLVFDEFARLCKYLRRIKEVTVLFDQLTQDTNGKGKLRFNEFYKFLVHTQGETNHMANIRDLFLTFSLVDPELDDSKDLLNKRYLDSAAFQIFLNSPQNGVLNARERSVWQPMDRPLSHYFISSSHNTYLEGNQLNSASSVEAYVRVLQRGCRCVELDCWDGAGEEPVIYHGRTATSKILVRDVCQAIAKYAFVASEYPVILSLEMHCSPPQQAKIASYLRSSFGDALITERLLTSECELPSPEQLKRRILIKGKGAPTVSEIPMDDWESGNSTKYSYPSRSFSNPVDITGASPTLPTSSSLPSTTSVLSSITLATSPPASMSAQSPPLSMESSPASTTGPLVTSLSPKLVSNASLSNSVSTVPAGHPDLLSLAVYLKSVKFTSFEEAARENIPQGRQFCTISSFSESSALKQIKVPERFSQFIQHNSNKLSRVYPGGLRVGSSNYNPMQIWAAGVQLVALNWQTHGMGFSYYLLRLNEFEDDFLVTINS